MEYLPTKKFALHLDAEDAIARFRKRFHIPRAADGRECVYLCGNSLGLQPKSARDFVEQELHDWASLGVDGHMRAKHPWVSYHELLTAPLAKLVGGKPAEVVAMNSLTTNLHLMLVSFYRPQQQRFKILMDGAEFPSDRWAALSHIAYHGYDPKTAFVELHPREGERLLREEDIEKTLAERGDSIAVVLLSGINYYTGQALDIARLTEAAHQQGCLIGVDLAHAIGNIPLHLHNWGVDFAVWCSYKYLNGGPGCPGGCFIHERHAERRDLPRFAGWWGHDKETRFKMPHDFSPIPGAEGWQQSNPPILALSALRASLEIFEEVGMAALRQKSERLTGFLAFLLSRRQETRFSLITPAAPERRGVQLSIRLPQKGRELFARLVRDHFIIDWREPEVIRVAPAPLYNSFLDVFRFAEAFESHLDALI